MGGYKKGSRWVCWLWVDCICLLTREEGLLYAPMQALLWVGSQSHPQRGITATAAAHLCEQAARGGLAGRQRLNVSDDNLLRLTRCYEQEAVGCERALWLRIRPGPWLPPRCR